MVKNMQRRDFLKLMAGAALVLPIAGCSTGAKTSPGSDSDTSSKSSVAPATVRWNAGTSGNVLLTIAKAKGWFEEQGITIEMIEATAVADAMTLLNTGKVDVVSNSGTAAPLQQIAKGQDFVIFGGHMVTGCMPIIAKKGVAWNGPQDFVGKTVAANPSYFALTGAVMDLGEDPMTAVNWMVTSSYPDAYAAVVRGEADYALQGTGHVQKCKESKDVDIMCYQSDIMADYSCCRMECERGWIEKNPELAKKVLVTLLRSQAYYEANKEEAVKLHAKETGVDEGYVKAFMLDKHYKVHVDPLKNSVVRAWGILDKTGFLDEKAKSIKIEDHIETKLYEEALAEAKGLYGSEYPDFFPKAEDFFKAQTS